MNRQLPVTLAATVVAVTPVSAFFRPPPSSRRRGNLPTRRSVSFAGKKIAALVITQDDYLRVAG